jgi:hypothetical protein
MFGLSKEEKKRAATRERVRRYREKQKTVTAEKTAVTNDVTPSQADCVTPKKESVTKMLCKCLYFISRDGRLVCSQCGQPPRRAQVGDKIHRAAVK